MYEEMDRGHAQSVMAHHAHHLDRLQNLLDVTSYNQATVTRFAPLPVRRQVSIDQSRPFQQTSLRSPLFEQSEANMLETGYLNKQRQASKDQYATMTAFKQQQTDDLALKNANENQHLARVREDEDLFKKFTRLQN